MKFNYIISSIIYLFLFTVPFSLLAQQVEPWCGNDAIMEEQIKENPNYLNELAEKVQHIREQAAQNPSDRNGTYIIPVVFHIIHDGGPGNISMEQIQSGIDVMNEDFNALNADATQIRNTTEAPFAPIHADVKVEFRLAKLDPNGNCTNGVQRKYAPHLTNDAGEACKSDANGGLSAWPNNKYINIWTVNSISGSGQGTTLGYAFLPYNNWGAGHGILNRHDRVGRVGTAANNGGRTLTHEMGHICGLLHTFQGGCHSNDCSQNGDYICDTPPSEQIFACNPSNNSCTNVPVNDFYGFDAFDQNENHMSYASCRIMYTEGQKTLMHNNFDNIPNFVSITSESNLIATGVVQPDEICKAEFSANQQVICSGQTIDFNDMSYHGQNSWDWSFSGGTPATSTDQNPSVTYNTPGVYEVSLTVSDGNNADSETKTAYITVLDEGLPLPYFESFENYTAIPNNNWSTGFSQTGGFEIGNTGLTGTQSAKLSNYNLPASTISELVSGEVDLSEVTDDITLSFRFAYKKRSTANDERLQVLISNNCGETWSIRRTLQGTNLGESLQASEYNSPSENDWVTVHMTNLTSQFWVENFRFKFIFTSDGGNNIFLDDINIYAEPPSEDPVLNISDISNAINSVSVYPNPTENNLNIDFSNQVAGNVKIELHDTRGSIVKSNNVYAPEGNNKIMFSTDDLQQGMYFLNIKNSSGVTESSHKIIILN